jgi:hypothetical protein
MKCAVVDTNYSFVIDFSLDDRRFAVSRLKMPEPLPGNGCHGTLAPARRNPGGKSMADETTRDTVKLPALATVKPDCSSVSSAWLIIVNVQPYRYFR